MFPTTKRNQGAAQVHLRSGTGVKAQSLGVDGITSTARVCGSSGEDDVPRLVLIPAAAKQIEIPMIASAASATPVAWWPHWRSGRRHQHGHAFMSPSSRASSERK